jgi:hypothetical protein
MRLLYRISRERWTIVMLQMSLEVNCDCNIKLTWFSNAVALESKGAALLISELVKTFISVA